MKSKADAILFKGYLGQKQKPNLSYPVSYPYASGQVPGLESENECESEE
jgi:hypothetical protein